MARVSYVQRSLAWGPPAVLLSTVALAGVDLSQSHYEEPVLDRWNYPFNPVPGARIYSSLFGNFIDETFEEASIAPPLCGSQAVTDRDRRWQRI